MFIAIKNLFVCIAIMAVFSLSEILVQPYLLIDAESPGTGIYVRWKSTANATVIYGVLGSEALDFSTEGDARGAHLEGLQPDTRYAYRVICNGDTSIAGSFRTAPASGTSVVIALTSDTQQVDKDGADTFKEMFVRFRPDLLVIVGDLIWSDGSTTCATNPYRARCSYDSLFALSPEVFANTILIPVKGNHDGTDQYLSTFSVLPDSGRFYTFQYGSIAFLAVDNGGVISSQPAYSKFRDTNALFKIGMDHEPTYALAGTRSSMRVAYHLENAGCQLILNGHLHFYSRTKWIKNPPTANGTYPFDVSDVQLEGYAIYNSPGCPKLDPFSGSPADYVAAYNTTNYSYSIAVVDSPYVGVYTQKGYTLGSNYSVIDSFSIDNRNSTNTYLPEIAKPIDYTIECSPNPFSNRIEISTKGVQSTIEVFSLNGKIVARDTKTEKLVVERLQNNGFYLIRAFDGKRSLSKKICLVR